MTIAPGRRGLPLAAACALLAACAGGSVSTAPTPANLSALEAQRAQHPSDPDLNLRLARAYYIAARYADARRALQTVLLAQPGNVSARAYLGLAYEGLERYDSARAVYTALLAGRPTRPVRRLLDGRLALLTQKELRQQARFAIARESLLVHAPSDLNTIAVMPFRYTGADSSLRPLERGLAAIVVTDLSRVRRLRLVEREQLQALLDELRLAASGRVDPATSARSGRLMGAGQVVQGQFSEVPTASFRVDASMVRASDAQISATGSGSDRLQALFDIEKTVVFQLLDKLGITLTPGERTAISERPTRDIQAFLLYSRGLEARDRGDFTAAAQAFQAAAQRDPGFAAAAQGAQTSQAAQTASTTPPAEVAVTLGGGGEGAGGGGGPPPSQNTLAGAINNTVPSGATSATEQTKPIPPTDPGRICEGKCDGVRATLTGTLVIIIKRP
jgi:tetratricopeptide (TPR) repeat protein